MYGYTPFYLSVHQLISICAISSPSPILSNAAMNILEQAFVWTFVFSDIYLAVDFLVHIVTLCLIYWETSRLFSKVAAQLCSPSSNVGRFNIFLQRNLHIYRYVRVFIHTYTHIYIYIDICIYSSIILLNIKLTYKLNNVTLLQQYLI